jgi:hypothetical protein
MINFSDDEEVTLTFTHIKTKEPSKLFVARNPLTGQWLQEHTIGKGTTAYYSGKNAVKKLVNDIYNKNTENNLPVEIKITQAKMT